MTDRARAAAIVRIGSAAAHTDQVLVAAEAPLIVRMTDEAGTRTRALGVLMRTPGDDGDLAVGALHAEGLLRHSGDLIAIRTGTHTDAGAGDDATRITDVVEAVARLDIDATPFTERAQTTTSACGLCGRLAMLSVERRGRANATATIDPAAIASLPERLRAHQPVFAATGGLHGAALVSLDGGGDIVREDVGRHNAVDKVIGAAFRAGRLPATSSALVVSGRVAYEIVQKAAMAGVPIVIAVGAPSSLAVDAARSAGLTLIGFARDGEANVYTGADRVRLPGRAGG